MDFILFNHLTLYDFSFYYYWPGSISLSAASSLRWLAYTKVSLCFLVSWWRHFPGAARSILFVFTKVHKKCDQTGLCGNSIIVLLFSVIQVDSYLSCIKGKPLFPDIGEFCMYIWHISISLTRRGFISID